MDISYLLWLQGLREALPPAVENFFVAISAIAISPALIVIPCILYWCLDKRAGQFMVLSFTLGTFFNQLIKNTVCCYRPWIRDAAIHPAAGALEEATGYSFPSGHTEGAVTLIGSWGWYYRRRWRWLFAGCCAFVALVGFSRNFLGVHTPQDVAVGLLEGVAVIAVVEPLLTWIDGAPGRDTKALVVALVACVVYVAYVALKPYPMDYDAAGNLLVDPVEMQVDCFKAAGVAAGFATGWFLERRYLQFEVDPHASKKDLVLRFALGIAVTGALHVCVRPLLAVGMDVRWYELVKNFLTIFGASFVGPAAFVALERRQARQEG